MRIQHNIAALNAHRQLTNNNGSVSKNLEKLSSGYRINRAGDDAAGLAISEKMRAQIKGLDTAQKNANDGISLIQTAEGALTETHSMLNRMVELSTQSANGTYDNDTDRANLQKEIESLSSEIDRISAGTNFNGIKLLDGSLIGSKVGITSSAAGAVSSNSICTLGTSENGVMTKGSATVNHSSKFYVGDIKNNNAVQKTIVINYKDNLGAGKTVTLNVAAGATFDASGIVAAIAGGTDDGDIMTTGKGGQLKDLYDVSLEGNEVVFKAKAHGTGLTGGDKLDGSKLEVTGIVYTGFDANDVTEAQKHLTEKVNGAAENPIALGSASGTATSYQAAVDGSYKVASTKLTLTTPDKLNNALIEIGNKKYILKDMAKPDEFVKSDDPNAVVVEYNSKTDTTAAKIGDKLAAKITADSANNGGFYATSDGAGVLTITETATRGNDILNNDKAATDIASQVKLTTRELKAGGKQEGSIDFTAFAAEGFGTANIKVGNKTYCLTSDSKINADAGSTVINYAKNSTADEIATALFDKLKADGVNVTNNNDGTLSFKEVDGKVTSESNGLTMQVGESSDSYQKVSVRVADMSSQGLGLQNLDISKQDGAQEAIDVIKNAINTVSSTRGDLGALQNRLEHTINNLGVTAENMTAAESRVRDVDMAKEMMEYTKNNILVQASQAMLAQANQLPQGVLQLLQ